MATEFQMHPAGIIETGNIQPGIRTFIIPRLMSKKAISVGNNSGIPLMHYTGPKKVRPPMVPTVQTTGSCYKDVCARLASLVTANEKDTLWLNSLSQGQDALEWNDFNNQLSRSQGVLKPETTYMFGPMIDAPPSHQDTILTTLSYIVDMGMTYVHLSVDMQLFVITKQVCWYHPDQFHIIITHPGGCILYSHS